MDRYIDIQEEVLNKEYILAMNDFEEAQSVENLIALARNIQTLLFLEQDSYPNHPKMGIGIKNYTFEFFDVKTINVLTNEIKDQIKTYIPNSKINDIIIQEIPSGDPSNVLLGLMFTLGEELDGKNEFIIMLKKIRKTSKVVSEIFV